MVRWVVKGVNPNLGNPKEPTFMKRSTQMKSLKKEKWMLQEESLDWNLAVTGRDFAGCYLGFPQFKICLKVEPGDFLLMDVHQWHCNTEMELLKPDGFRISYVLYLREHMSKCANHRVIENTHYYEQKIEKTLR